MFRDFDEFGRRTRRSPQVVEIPQRHGRVRQPRDLQEAYWLLQQDLQQARSDAAAWKTRAQRLETALQQAKHPQQQQERALLQAQAELKAAREQIAVLEAKLADQADTTPEKDAWQEKYTRLYANFENDKKRLEQRFALEAEQEKEKILRDMLPLADNLERALAHAKDSEEETGIALTLKAFMAVLQQYGVAVVAEEGVPFNPEMHEAIGVVIQPDKEAGTILTIEEKGYTLKGKLLRPAKVLVVAD